MAKRDENRPLLLLFLISAIAIPLFYAAGLMYGQRSPPGHRRILALVGSSPLGGRLLRSLRHGGDRVPVHAAEAASIRTATRAVLFSTVVFLSGGIIGTFHHLYFTGTPNSVLALGAVFSALEVVPLVLIGFEAWENIRLARGNERAVWVPAYKWPIYFFVAVAFWNFVGAGLFGFFINPPVALYYMQGLNTTPVHGHTALFGVYGMLGLGLMLFCLRALRPGLAWKDKPLAFAFWCNQHRAAADGGAEPATDRTDAGVGVGGVRHVVCALGRVPASRSDEHAALDAHDWRYRFRDRSAGAGLVRTRAGHWTLVRQDGNGRGRRVEDPSERGTCYEIGD